MNIQPNMPSPKAAEQVTNNSTGWVGQVPGNPDRVIKGQTFVASREGDLESIQIFSNLVAGNSQLQVTLHHFDEQRQQWGNVLGTASVSLQGTDAGKWIAFNMPSTHLKKGETYGFRLDSNDSYVGLGEACSSARQPVFDAGKEWQFRNNDARGDSFSFISLAFKVQLAA